MIDKDYEIGDVLVYRYMNGEPLIMFIISEGLPEYPDDIDVHIIRKHRHSSTIIRKSNERVNKEITYE